MDPYLEFEFEGQIKKSEVCQKGGTTPTWTDTICFQRARDFLLNIKLWDYERYKAHDLIASTEINVSEIMAQGFKDADV
jgi:Ca2+-dependent lipid-binding protein